MSERLLSPKVAAVPLLARGMSTDAVGREVGVDGRTVRVWREEPAFRAEVEAARKAVLEEAVAALTTAVRKAVDVLHAALDDNSVGVRIKAASEIVRALPLIASHAELEGRVAALEAALEAKEQPSVVRVA